MTTEQPLTSELEPGPLPFWARLRNILAVPAGLLGVLIVPDRLMPRLIQARRGWAAFVAILLCGLTSAYVIGSRIDVTPTIVAEEAKVQKEKGAEYEPKSDREMKEDIEKGRTVEQVKLGLSAGLGVPAVMGLLTIFYFLLGRFVGGRTTFGGSATMVALVRLPFALKSLLVAGMALPSPTLTPADVDAMNAVSALHLAKVGPLANLSVDVFGLWSAALLIFGFAAVAQVSRKKSFVTVLVLYVLYLLLSVGVAGMMSGGGMPPGGPR